jgi:type IV secretory pathway VirB6-like protein
MKKNNLKYVLMLGVVVIWGTIIYRIIQSLKTDQPLVTFKNIPRNNTPDPIDTFSLLLNYDNPFSGNPLTSEIEDTIVTDKSLVTHAEQLSSTNNPPTPVQKNIQQAPDFVKYSGYIYNPQKKMQMVMVTIQNQSFAMTENMEINDVTVKKITRNKLTIRYKGNDFTITKSY